jgi:hypothetical protein
MMNIIRLSPIRPGWPNILAFYLVGIILSCGSLALNGLIASRFSLDIANQASMFLVFWLKRGN